MKTVGIILLCLVGLFVLLLLMALVKTLLGGTKVSVYRPAAEDDRAHRYAEKLSAMVQHNTVASNEDRRTGSFLEFHKLLAQLFPLVHQHLEKTEIDGNLLYCWKGISGEKPIVLMSHQDVVPAEGEWLHGPFSGDIADGLVWGRGSADTKCSLMAIFQSIEELLAEGITPPQDVYIASSCTEEFGGDGAPKIVAELQRRGVKPYAVFDEGGAIIDEPVGGVKGLYAMVGVFEKGQGNLRFTARGRGGHSSAPPRKTPLVELSKFVCEVNKKDPFRREISRELKAMFALLSPYSPFAYRFLFGNLWLFGGLLKAVMPMVSSQAAAMLRTSVAFTMAQGSEACNVIPQSASVVANLRFIPHQKKDASIAILQKMAEKYGIETEIINGHDPSPVLDIHGEVWALTERVIAEVFPDLPAIPYVVTGGTDCRFFHAICDHCVRFSPVVYGKEQLSGMHGLNETISVNCLPGAVEFYKKLIQSI
ncbi:MAG: M20/M25/M40 family metallo-hydrolase [Oscillospiraceae bacterium]|nr:M20/M25/M40 family metallo-hydrolase [Oscillospiraceae bacterium]